MRDEPEGNEYLSLQNIVTSDMPTQQFSQRVKEYLQQPVESRLQRLASTPDELGQVIKGHSDVTLSHRPGPKKWSAKEVVCHLRDIEELVIMRFHLMLVADEPRVFVAGVQPSDPGKWGIDDQVPCPSDPDRWAEERQYQRNDAFLALSAFCRRRREVITLFRRLTPEQWQRGCVFPDDRRLTFEGWTAAMAAHDDGHLAQLQHALASAALISEGTSQARRS